MSTTLLQRVQNRQQQAVSLAERVTARLTAPAPAPTTPVVVPTAPEVPRAAIRGEARTEAQRQQPLPSIPLDDFISDVRLFAETGEADIPSVQGTALGDILSALQPQDTDKPIKAQVRKAVRQIATMPIDFLVGFPRDLIKDPVATAAGLVEGINQNVNDFASIQSPLSTPQQREAALNRIGDNPTGLALTAAMLKGIGEAGAKVLGKAERIAPAPPAAPAVVEPGLKPPVPEAAPIEVAMPLNKVNRPSVHVKEALVPALRGGLKVAIPKSESIVTKMLDKQRVDSVTLLRPNSKKIANSIKRKVVDISAGVKKELRAAGPAGKRAIMEHDLAAGANANAQRILDPFQKALNKLTVKEERLLSDRLQIERTIEIDTFRDRQGKPRAESPGGLHREQLAPYLLKMRLQNADIWEAKIEPLAKMQRDLMRGNLEALLSEGLIDRATFTRLSEFEKYSLRQYVQHLDPEVTHIGRDGRKITVNDSGIAALEEGSTNSLLNDVRFLTAQSVARTQARIFKNRANKALYDLAIEQPENGIVTLQEIIGATEAGAPTFAKAPKGQTSLSVMIEGKQRRMLMPDELARDWVTVDPEISPQIASVMRHMSGTSILKPFATGLFNPEFALTNIPRDMGHILLTTSEYSSTLPYGAAQLTADMFRVAPDVFRRKGIVNEYIEHGGGMELLADQGSLRTGKLATLKKPGKVNAFSRKMDGVIEAMEYFQNTSELWTRMALKRRSLDNGATRIESSWIARNYMDFAQGGSYTKALNNGIPYLNAAVQGTRGLFRAAAENPATFSYKVSQIMAMSYGLYLANRKYNPEALEGIGETDRNSNWIITTPFADDKYIAIPKDQGQRLFASLAEAMAARIHYGELPSGQVLRGLEDALPLIPGGSLSPSMAAVLGYTQNRDFWLNEDIWKGQDVRAGLEFTEGMNPAFKALGAVGEETPGAGGPISPIRTQRALQKVFTYRNIYTDLVGAGMRVAVGDDPKLWGIAQEDFSKMPFVRRVFKSTRPDIKVRGEIKETLREENSTRLIQNREIRRLIDVGEDFRPYINSQPPTDRKRLLTRGLAIQKQGDLAAWWYDALDLSPEARASIFYKQWANSESKSTLEATAARINGFTSDRFNRMFNKLRSE